MTCLREQPSVSGFLKDEAGAATVFNLIMFFLFAGLGGMAMDISNAMRYQAVLQSTVDAAAHAGAVRLPQQASAVAEAITFAEHNMAGSNSTANIIKASDVQVGYWDPTARTFQNGGKSIGGNVVLNAVGVQAFANSDRNNGLGTLFMGWVGLSNWDQGAEAIAVAATDDCINKGLLALDRVDMSSGNTLLPELCVHGEAVDAHQGTGVEFQQGYTVHCGAVVSVPGIEAHLQVPSDPYDGVDVDAYGCSEGQTGVPATNPYDSNNPGMLEALQTERKIRLEIEIDAQLDILLGFANGARTSHASDPDNNDVAFGNPAFPPMADYADPTFQVRPAWLPTGGSIGTAGNPLVLTEAQFAAIDFKADTTVKVAGVTYPLANLVMRVECTGGGNNRIELEGTISNLSIFTNCEIKGKNGGGGKGGKKNKDEAASETGAASLVLSNVLLYSTALGNGANPRDQATIQFPSDAQLGTATCGNGGDGGVIIAGFGTVKLPAKGSFYGAKIITEGSLEMSAQQSGQDVYAIVGDDIKFTSGSVMGVCPEGFEGNNVTVRDYVLVH